MVAATLMARTQPGGSGKTSASAWVPCEMLGPGRGLAHQPGEDGEEQGEGKGRTRERARERERKERKCWGA